MRVPPENAVVIDKIHGDGVAAVVSPRGPLAPNDYRPFWMEH